MSNEPLVPSGTSVIYWGNAKTGSLYGKEMVVEYANQCGCKHQTYALKYFDEATNSVKRLEQVLSTSFTILQE